MPLRLCWYSSLRDSAALELFDSVTAAIADGRAGEVLLNSLVLTRRESDPLVGETLRLAHERGVTEVILHPAADFEPNLRKDPALWRSAYHAALAERLPPDRGTIGLLVGYMLIVDGAFLDDRLLLNLHPALPGGPAGKWEDVIEEVVHSQVREFGAMLHVATRDLDRGPCITYTRFPVHGPVWDSLWSASEDARPSTRADARQTLANRIRQEEFSREAPLIISTLLALSQNPALKVTHDGLLQNGVLAGPLEVQTGA